VTGAASIAAWKFWPENGLWNSCRPGTPRALARHPAAVAAWDGLDAAQVWDSHAHLVGIGDSSSGIQLNPRMTSLASPSYYARRAFFLNAGCAYGSEGNVDMAYVRRLAGLLDGMKRGAKVMLFAFERAYGEDGHRDDARTAFHVPDGYAREVAREHARVFEWVASIHPYRADCVRALEEAKRDGARGIKWLPSAMGIDPASPRCDRFYEAAARLKLPIISHAGKERAVESDYTQDYGNPLRLRRALDAGVRVVVAHCASMGEDRDIDKGQNGPYVESFSLFARLMQDKRYEKNLFGDIAALPQINRAGFLPEVIERTEWHPRLLNGSDYPLPGVMPLFSTRKLVDMGLLAESVAEVLQEIRPHNPLLFDFVLKRHLRSGNKALSAGIFETRRFFEAQ